MCWPGGKLANPLFTWRAGEIFAKCVVTEGQDIMKNWKMVLTALVLLLIGGFALWHDVHEYQEIRELRKTGVDTSGQVVESDYRKISKRSHYYLTVEFQAQNGNQQKIQKEVPYETYTAFKDGGNIKVRYLADRPEVCLYGDKEKSMALDLALSTFLVCMGLLSALFVFVDEDPNKAKNDAVNKGATTLKDGYVYTAVMDPLKEFPLVDHEFYHRTRKQLEEFGFRYLGDEKMVNVKMNTFLRYFVTEDGSMYAACYYFKPGTLVMLLGAKESRTVEFCSALTDGTFIGTSNAESLSGLQYPELVQTEHLSADTPVPELIARHRRRLQKLVSPEVQPIEVRTMEDLHKIGNAEQKVKARWRKDQTIDPSELRAIAKEALSGKMASV